MQIAPYHIEQASVECMWVGLEYAVDLAGVLRVRVGVATFTSTGVLEQCTVMHCDDAFNDYDITLLIWHLFSFLHVATSSTWLKNSSSQGKLELWN